MSNLTLVSDKAEQKIWMNTKPKKPGGKAGMAPVIIGTICELDNGVKVTLPDGRVVQGRGTRIRFNFKHGTMSVQWPDQIKRDRLGRIDTHLGEVTWIEGKRKSGLTESTLRRSFGKEMCDLIMQVHAQELAAVEEKRKRETADKQALEELIDEEREARRQRRQARKAA